MSSVVTLAGRRVDPAEADTPRFTLENVQILRQRLQSFLHERQANALVCSAACGADLVALEAAEELGLRRRVVLPFSPERFREASVTDRPGDWRPLYDRVIDTVSRAGDLVVLQGAGEGGAAYAAANARILDEALTLTGVGAARGPKAAPPRPEKGPRSDRLGRPVAG